MSKNGNFVRELLEPLGTNRRRKRRKSGLTPQQMEELMSVPRDQRVGKMKELLGDPNITASRRDDSL